jgi:hypothetical protein
LAVQNSDPNSELSKAKRGVVAKLLGIAEDDPLISGKSGAEFDSLLPSVKEINDLNKAKYTTENRAISRENLQNERESRRDERLDKNRAGLVEKFNADPAVKKAQQSMDAAKTIRDLALSGNPIAASSIPTYSARMSGEVGNLSEADKKPFGGSQAIAEKINAAMKQMSTGRLSDSNKKFIINLSDIIEKRSNQNMSSLARLRAKQYSKIESYGTEDELFNLLRPAETIEVNPDVSIMTPEKKARLEELRAKKKAGTIK